MRRNTEHRIAKRNRSRRTLSLEGLEDRRLLTLVPGSVAPGDPYILAFATSQSTLPSFGGTVGGDAFVQQVVNSTNSPVTCDTSACPNYRAIMSDSGQDANALPIPAGVPIFNTNGQLVANSVTDLWNTGSTPLLNPIDHDEAGNFVDAEVWTGTNPVGNHSGLSAGDWTGPGSATIGIAGHTDARWIDTSVASNTALKVYGISEVLTAPNDTGSIHGQKWWDVNGNGLRDCETIVVSGGVLDDFDTSNSEPTSPRPGLAAEVANPNPPTGYDATVSDRYFVETLEFSVKNPIKSATLRVTWKPISFAENDAINIFSSTWPTAVRDAYNINDLVGRGSWDSAVDPSAVTTEIVISDGVLLDMMTNSQLDIYIQDDTAVDYLELEIVTCEPGLDGWTIEVDDPVSGQLVASQVTHSMDLNDDMFINPVMETGLYWIDGLPAGKYHVGEVVQPGWMQSSPDPEVAINGTALADNYFAAFVGSETGTSLTRISQTVGTGPQPPAGKNIISGTTTPAPDITTDEEYLYFATWSDGGGAQGFIADVTIDGQHMTTNDHHWTVHDTNNNFNGLPGPTDSDVASGLQTATWHTPALGPTNQDTLFGLVNQVSGVAHDANWIWHNSGNQTSTDAPFTPGFDHGEFLIMRLATGAGKHVVNLSPGEVVEGIDFGNKGTGSIHGQKTQKVRQHFREEHTTAQPSDALNDFFMVSNRTTKPFGSPAIDRFVGDSFTGLPSGIVSGFLYVEAAPKSTSLTRNDTLSLGVIDPLYGGSGSPWLAAQGKRIGGTNGWLGSTWNTANYGPTTIKIPIDPTVIAQMNSSNRLDVIVQDDTTVISTRLVLVYEKMIGLNDWTISVTPTSGGPPVICQQTHDMDLNGDGVIDPMTERGLYWIENLPPGQYDVTETLKPGWTPVTPASGSQVVTVGPGQSVQGVDFLNRSWDIAWNPADVDDLLNDAPIGLGGLSGFIGNPVGQIDFDGLAGVMPSNQFASLGVTFNNLAGLGANQEGDPNSVETLDGFGGTYRPDGDTVYVSWPNHIEPIEIVFDDPVSSVGSFIGTGKEGTTESLTVEAFDVNGNLLLSEFINVTPNDDPDNREGFWGLRFNEDIMSRVTIRNNNTTDFGNALILDDIQWGRTQSYVADLDADRTVFDSFFSSQSNTPITIDFSNSPPIIPGDNYSNLGITLNASAADGTSVDLVGDSALNFEVDDSTGFLMVPGQGPESYADCLLDIDDPTCGVDPTRPIPGLEISFDEPVETFGFQLGVAGRRSGDNPFEPPVEPCERVIIRDTQGQVIDEIVVDVDFYADSEVSEGFFTYDGQGTQIGSVIVQPLDPSSGDASRFDPNTTLTIDNLTFTRSSATACDFDGDGNCDVPDVDALVGEIVSGANAVPFDLTGDGLVDADDLDEWLTLAGAENLGPGRAYLPGDADLNGIVDGLDFIVWNSNKFTSGGLWSGGDWNADGNTDGQDFVIWNSFKFQSADRLVSAAGLTLLPQASADVEQVGEEESREHSVADWVFAADWT